MSAQHRAPFTPQQQQQSYGEPWPPYGQEADYLRTRLTPNLPPWRGARHSGKAARPRKRRRVAWWAFAVIQVLFAWWALVTPVIEVGAVAVLWMIADVPFAGYAMWKLARRLQAP